VDAGWATALSAIAGGFSAMTAVAAIVIAVRNERRSIAITRAQMYLLLRQGFFDIFKELGDLDGTSDIDGEQRQARIAYWHHAYDEWRVAKLAPKELGDLWTEHFRTATESGYRHPALRRTFDALSANTDEGFGAYAQDFVADLSRDLRDSSRSASGSPRPP
jgi:hypothetical protein